MVQILKNRCIRCIKQSGQFLSLYNGKFVNCFSLYTIVTDQTISKVNYSVKVISPHLHGDTVQKWEEVKKFDELEKELSSKFQDISRMGTLLLVSYNLVMVLKVAKSYLKTMRTLQCSRRKKTNSSM